MKNKTRTGNCKEWVVVWHVEKNEFRVVPLTFLIEGMQEAFVKGVTTRPPFVMLGLVKSEREAQELTNKLATCREAFFEFKEEVTTATA